jgi:tRNA pseudouridine55 synthase
MATGVLPVCVGPATKLVPYLMAGDKTYAAVACLGVTTDTLDAEGRVTGERDAAHITYAAVTEALAGFVGVIQQRPPMHSAIRVGGRRLYELAREGKEVEREPRAVEVHAITVDGFEPGARASVRFSVRCGKGTYIRAIAGELGERLGVGAHLTALRRTRVGAFAVADAVALDDLAAARLIAPADALADLPAVRLDDAAARDVRDGKLRAIAALGAPAPRDGLVRLLRADGSLVAVAEQCSGRLALSRVFS